MIIVLLSRLETDYLFFPTNINFKPKFDIPKDLLETQVKQDILITESTPQERAEQEAHQHDEDDDDCSVEDVTVTSPRLAAPRGINSALTA